MIYDARKTAHTRASELMDEPALRALGQRSDVWSKLLLEILQAWRVESGDEPVQVRSVIEFIFESLAQRRRDETFGHGVVLNTIHAAKGTEYNHVLLAGDWSRTKAEDMEEERRVLYVGMTRARKSLSIFHRMDARNRFVPELTGPCFQHFREVLVGESLPPDLLTYDMLGLGDVYLDYAGMSPEASPIHRALSELQPGDPLSAKQSGNTILLLDSSGRAVAQMAKGAAAEWINRLSLIVDIRVVALVARH